MNDVASENRIADQVVTSIRSVVGDGPAALHEPLFSGNEWTYLKECLDSTYVSYKGSFVNRFERQLAEYTGAEHAIALVSGTAALHAALHVAGVQPGDEVLVPTLCFVATANAVCYCGAIPHFVDSECETLGIDAEKLSRYLETLVDINGGECTNRTTGRTIRAVIPMHVFGHPSNLDGLMAVASEHNLMLVEDAAESLGSRYHGHHTGTFGQLGVLSFNGNKTITTGGGGAVLTDDADLAERLRHVTTTAKMPHPWEYRHDEIGYNYRLPSLNAALGCAQLEELPGFVDRKRRLYRKYAAAFSNVPGIHLMSEPANCRSNYWLQTLLLEAPLAEQRDRILERTNSSGYMTRPVWQPLHRLRPYMDCPTADLSQSEALCGRLINIPSGPGLLSE